MENKWTNYEEQRQNNVNAANADPETIAAREKRQKCDDDKCGPYPSTNGLSNNDASKKIKAWMNCYNACLKEVPYTAAEQLRGNYVFPNMPIDGGRRRRHRKTARKNRKHRRATRRN